MMAFFEEYLKNLSADVITNGFFIAMLIVAGLGFISYAIRQKKYQEFADYAPVLLTSLGILGTFTGIVSGLLNFDIDHIDSSISTLLGGMKTAFLTSVIGVCLSILLKLLYTLLPRKSEKNEENHPLDIQAVVNNFYEQTEQLKAQQQQTERTNLHLENLAKSLGADSEGSILGQIKLLRADLSDHYKQKIEPMNEHLAKISNILVANQQSFSLFETQLWHKLQDFADMMSKSATEAVIDALKQVIVEFNQNLTEQFGENFKELNSAVVALIDWQENYKNQLNEMIALYNAGVQSLSITEQSVASIEQSSQAIPETMEDLNEILKVNQHQIANLQEHLTTFAMLRDKAVAAVPEIQDQIDLMLTNTETANKAMLAGFNQNHQALLSSANTLEKTAEIMNSQQKVFVEQQNQLTKQTLDFVNEWQNRFERNTQEIQKQFTDSLETLVQSHLEDSRKVMGRLEKESETALSRTGESINKQIQALDSALETELNRVIGDMGRALTTISSRFTEDYSRLVGEMQKITQARGRF